MSGLDEYSNEAREDLVDNDTIHVPREVLVTIKIGVEVALGKTSVIPPHEIVRFSDKLREADRAIDALLSRKETKT